MQIDEIKKNYLKKTKYFNRQKTDLTFFVFILFKEFFFRSPKNASSKKRLIFSQVKLEAIRTGCKIYLRNKEIST